MKMVRLAILTGMRQAEQFSVRWEHVDLERGLNPLPATKVGGVQYAHLSLTHLKGVMERVSEFGKPPAESLEEKTPKGTTEPVSNGTVTETGTEVESVGICRT